MARSDSPRSVVHAEFHLERVYDSPVWRVWQALTEPQAKAQWFAGSADTWQVLERQMDVRVGGRERLRGRWKSGLVTTFEAVYQDVVPNERLVYCYQMFLDDEEDLRVARDLAARSQRPRHSPQGGRARRISRWLR